MNWWLFLDFLLYQQSSNTIPLKQPTKIRHHGRAIFSLMSMFHHLNCQERNQWANERSASSMIYLLLLSHSHLWVFSQVLCSFLTSSFQAICCKSVSFVSNTLSSIMCLIWVPTKIPSSNFASVIRGNFSSIPVWCAMVADKFCLKLLMVHTLYSFALECIQILMATVVWNNVDHGCPTNTRSNSTLYNHFAYPSVYQQQ